MDDSPNKETNDTDSHIPELSTQNSDIEDPKIFLKQLGERMQFWWNHIAQHISSNQIIAGFTVVIALTGIAYTVFAALQWSVMNGQLTELQQQTFINRQQLVGTQKAILDWNINFNNIGNVTVSLANRGHVAAPDNHFKLDATEATLPDGTPVGTSLHFEVQIPPLKGDGGDFSHFWITPWKPKQLGVRYQWPKDWPGKTTYILRGELTYQDGFGNTESQPFCKEWLPDYYITWGKQGSGGNGFGELRDCADIKSTISSILRQEKEAEHGAERPN